MAKKQDELTEQREQTGTSSRSAESRRKKAESQQPQQTMEDFLLAQLNEEVILKDGTQLKAADGHVMTKQEAIATNILNLAMKGDVKAAQYIQNIQMRAKIMKKK